MMTLHSGVNVVVKEKARLDWLRSGEWDVASISMMDIHHSPSTTFLLNCNDKQMCC